MSAPVDELRAELRQRERKSKVWREIAEEGDGGTEPLPAVLNALDKTLVTCRSLLADLTTLQSRLEAVKAERDALKEQLHYTRELAREDHSDHCKLHEAAEAKYGPHPADGMTVAISMGGGAYSTIINPLSFADGGPEWVMRYGNPEGIRYSVASLLETYDYLLSDAINMTEATRRLRIMRAVRRALLSQPDLSKGGEE